MIPYGKSKRIHKHHPHNECEICSENGFNKKKARQEAQKEIQSELLTLLEVNSAIS
jgi:hypothetical protein